MSTLSAISELSPPAPRLPRSVALPAGPEHAGHCFAALVRAQAARDASSEAFRSAATLAGAPPWSTARTVRTLDLRAQEAREAFERMTEVLSLPAAAAVSREVALAREAYGKVLAALTCLRCEAARPAPRGAEVRSLSAQVYSGLAHIQATIGGIRRKLDYLCRPAASLRRAP